MRTRIFLKTPILSKCVSFEMQTSGAYPQNIDEVYEGWTTA